MLEHKNEADQTVLNQRQAMEAFAELKTAVKDMEKKFAPAEVIGKIEKIQSALEVQEKENQKLLGEKNAEKKEKEELIQRLTDLEKKAGAPGEGKLDAADQAKLQIKHLEHFVRSGELPNSAATMEHKYLRTDSATDGGFLAPPAYEKSIRKNITEISNIRGYAKVSTIGAGRVEMPNRQSLISSYWAGEADTITASNSKYGLDAIKTHKLVVMNDITIEDLQDSAFDMEGEIASDVAEEFARNEGAAFITGTSATSNQIKPEGLMVNPSVTYRPSLTVDTITMDAILLMTGDLKIGYNPVFGMNRRTLATIRTMKDGVGQYYWQAGNLAAGVPNQLAGYDYFLAPDFDDIGANAYPILFGDLGMGYQIVDRLALFVTRDAVTQMGNGKVRFIFMRRVGGQVTRTEALRKLKCAVS